MLGLPVFDHAEIELRNSTLTAMVDDEDAEWAAGFTWYLDKSGYARTWDCRWLHQAIVDRAGLIRDENPVDHINRDALDCRRSNLRIVTWQQNAWNRSGWTSKATPKGVNRARNGKWQARIMTAGRREYLGTFDSAEEASAAYLRAAVERRGPTFTGVPGH